MIDRTWQLNCSHNEKVSTIYQVFNIGNSDIDKLKCLLANIPGKIHQDKFLLNAMSITNIKQKYCRTTN